ncbi:hypothetical protein AAY473_027422 [Plecturocebus cupreus]
MGQNNQRASTVAPSCNSSILGGQGGQIISSVSLPGASLGPQRSSEAGAGGLQDPEGFGNPSSSEPVGYYGFPEE